jgi:hypothetical protein
LKYGLRAEYQGFEAAENLPERGRRRDRERERGKRELSPLYNYERAGRKSPV